MVKCVRKGEMEKEGEGWKEKKEGRMEEGGKEEKGEESCTKACFL